MSWVIFNGFYLTFIELWHHNWFAASPTVRRRRAPYTRSVCSICCHDKWWPFFGYLKQQHFYASRSQSRASPDSIGPTALLIIFRGNKTSGALWPVWVGFSLEFDLWNSSSYGFANIEENKWKYLKFILRGEIELTLQLYRLFLGVHRIELAFYTAYIFQSERDKKVF